MGRKLQIAVAAVIVLMLGAAVGAYAWDNSRSDEIAEGITIGGVDVSGMTGDEARKVVDAKLVEPLQKHVTVDFEGVKYKLSPERLEVSRCRRDGRSRDRGEPGGRPCVRVFRYATGGEVDVAISPQLSYSNQALNEFIAKVAAEVNRDPIDASIEPTATSLSPVEGQDGVAVVEDKLRAKLESAVQSPTERRVALPVERVKPEVTTDELAQYPTYLTLNRGSFQLNLWKDLELSKTYTVAVGAVGFDTPAGVYNIQNKAVDPAWTVPDSDWTGDLAGTVVPGGVPENRSRSAGWESMTAPGSTAPTTSASLGTAASHGCVRMSIPDVIELYDQVPVGTPIYIG